MWIGPGRSSARKAANVSLLGSTWLVMRCTLFSESRKRPWTLFALLPRVLAFTRGSDTAIIAAASRFWSRQLPRSAPDRIYGARASLVAGLGDRLSVGLDPSNSRLISNQDA